MKCWISVEDRLPEDDGDVLVCYDWRAKEDNAYFSHESPIVIDFLAGGKWVHDVYYGDITHWMPLPDPPEEDK